MTYLVARIDYALTRGINWLTTCLIERARGFNSSEAGDYIEETCLFCGKLRTERFCRPGVLHGGQDWAADALAEFVDVQSTFRSSADDRIMDALRSYAATQAPEAGQPGENPAGVTPPTPAGSPDPSRVTVGAVRGEGSPAEIATFPRRPAGERPTWVDWAVPAICDVLAVHVPFEHLDGKVTCVGNPAAPCPHFLEFADAQDWRDHVAPLIADRLGAAMESDALRSASETFPQFRTTPK